MGDSLRLILLPGMGADERLFGPQRAAFPDLVVPRWIAPRRAESLPDYARRLADRIPAGDPFVLGGVSFGGMVACELARVLSPRALALVASASDNGFLSRRQRGAAFAGQWIPESLLRRFPDSQAIVSRFASTRDPAHSRLLVEMFRDADPAFLKWSAGAVASWRAAPLPGHLPVHRLHGRRDRIIPLRPCANQTVVADAGHLVNLSRADETNAFLRGVLDSARLAAPA